MTHFHGDHCLGVPGVVQRLSLDRVAHPVYTHFSQRYDDPAAFHAEAARHFTDEVIVAEDLTRVAVPQRR